MKSKYWVQFGWENPNSTNDSNFWVKTSEFITVGADNEFPDLEAWWFEESQSDLPHEIFQVVKL